MKIKTKRIYEAPEPGDGYRVLVDRLWPRGVKKEEAQLDEWNKQLPPSTELRKWFGHKTERFNDFAKRYALELSENTEELKRIRAIAKKQPVTLLYAAKDPEINHAVILKSVLNGE